MRDMFLEAVVAFIEWRPDDPEPTVTFEVGYVPRSITVTEACRLLWNCADILPGQVFYKLRTEGLNPRRQTYAAAARAILQHLRAVNRRALAA
jgi:hypothetical protein